MRIVDYHRIFSKLRQEKTSSTMDERPTIPAPEHSDIADAIA